MDLSVEKRSLLTNILKTKKREVKADHNNVYCFLITIFRLAIPAFYKPEEGWYGHPKYCYEKAIDAVMISFAVVFRILVFRRQRAVGNEDNNIQSNNEIRSNTFLLSIILK